MQFITLLIVLLVAVSSAGDSVPPLEDLVPDNMSFTTVKKRLYGQVHKDQEVTFYCGCLFNPEPNDDGVKNETNLGTCGMSGLTSTRAKRAEAEHVVTAFAIGNALGCWADGGRSGCLKTDAVFKEAHNDLHNLVPAVGAVNGARSNIPFGMIVGEERKYGDCDVEVNREGGRVEPKSDVRGDIARINFYMEYQYGVSISRGQRRLMLWWGREDPVDEWEYERDGRIFIVQGNHNPFVVGARP